MLGGLWLGIVGEVFDVVVGEVEVLEGYDVDMVFFGVGVGIDG